MDILEIAYRKLAIVLKNENLTEEEQEMYLGIFVQDIVNNLGYERAVLNGLLYVKK